MEGALPERGIGGRVGHLECHRVDGVERFRGYVKVIVVVRGWQCRLPWAGWARYSPL